MAGPPQRAFGLLALSLLMAFAVACCLPSDPSTTAGGFEHLTDAPIVAPPIIEDSPPEFAEEDAPSPEPPTPVDRAPAVSSRDMRPTMAEFAKADRTYEELLHWRNRRKWGTAPSMGDPVNGRLPGGVELPHEGKHHAVMERCRERGTNHGAPRLIELIDHAATRTHKAHPGARLMVCNLSIKDGGRMRWSRSHGAGRDADFGFFVSREGASYELKGLLTFEHGLEREVEGSTYTFDVARNWTLVESLLTHPTIEVQWIFVSTPLRKAMLAHAMAQGASLDLLIRARQIVRQPLDSQPHNDHFHVRIYCDPGERIHGCRDREPYWPWVVDRDPRLARRAAALSLGLRDKSKEMRGLALERIESRRLYDASSALVEVALMSPNGEMQAKAMDILVDWKRRDADVAAAIDAFVRPSGGGLTQDDPDFSAKKAVLSKTMKASPFKPWAIGEGKERRASHIIRAYVLLGRLGTEEAAPFLADALVSKRRIGLGSRGTPEALLAANASRHVMDVRLVPALLQAIEHPRGDVREAAIRALERITNHSEGGRWGDKVPKAQIDANVARWRAWWKPRAKTATRESLLKEGFERHKVTLGPLRSFDTVIQLASAMKHPDPVAYNADRLLSWLTGRRSVLDATSSNKRKRWQDWLGGD